MIKLVKNQMYLAFRQTSFWIGMLITGGYGIVCFLYDCIRYWGYDSSGTRSASELFIYSTHSPFWTIFSMLIPFLGLFAFSMQPVENNVNHAECYLISRVSKKEYCISGALCSVAGTFLLVELPALISMALYYFTFEETGITFQGAKYSTAYWQNLNDHGYRFQELHINHPWLYIFMFSIIFAVGCSVIAFFLFACSTILKKGKQWMLFIAGVMSFAIMQFSAYSGYDFYGDIVISETGNQSGIPTIMLGCMLVMAGVIILRLTCGETDYE